MIKTNNAEMDSLVEILSTQRNEALDLVAVLTNKNKALEARLREQEPKAPKDAPPLLKEVPKE